jgi:peptidoglycan/xylan/chitin deacetylase (PgdA/CDA1 family)
MPPHTLLTRYTLFRILILTGACVVVIAIAIAMTASLRGVPPAQAATNTPTPRPSPTARPTPTPRPPASVRVPILMYHYISDPPPGSDKLRVDLSLSPKQFEAQLRYLKENGFTTVSLQDVYDLLKTGKPLPTKPVVLTFDDGYLDHYTEAFPLLKKYGMMGTFFIVTDYIVYKNPEHLTWPMVKEMARAGMSIESHSRTHKDMRNRSTNFLVWEILGPVEQIEAYAGKRPRFFCYPTGKYDARVIKILRDVGTHAAVTTEHGSTYTLANAMEWPRLRVRNTTSIEGFANLVETAHR